MARERDKLQELEDKVRKDQEKLKNLRIKELEKESGFKLGEIVEFIVEGDSYNNERDSWNKGQIWSLEKSGDTIWAKVQHESVKISKLKRFDDNDYSLRHEVYERELSLGDEFQLICEKPNATIKKKYQVYKIITEVGKSIQYWFLNDENELGSLKEGEFHITNPI